MIQTIKMTIAETLAKNEALAALGAEQLCAMLMYPPDNSMGDIALPCFRFAKEMRLSPDKVAASIADSFACECISEVLTAGGYLNFRINAQYLAQTTLSAVAVSENYGSDGSGVGSTIVLDYSAPNIAKPFHVGHLCSTLTGHSLKKLFEFAGYKCVGVNHLGDWGTQFGKLIVAYKLWGDKAKIEAGGIDELVAIYVKYHDEAAKDPTLDDKARQAFAALEAGDPECIEIWKWFNDVSLAEYDKIYSLLNIEFESNLGESFYFDKVAPQVEIMRDKGVLSIDDGASIVSLEEEGMPPCLILKSDGSTIYAARDIAAAVYRKETYDFSRCIYVTSNGQSLHFKQFFTVLAKMGYEWADKLVHIAHGTLSFGKAKLATRTGNVILLRDLFDAAITKAASIIAEKRPDEEVCMKTAQSIGVGAVVYNYLSSNREKDADFSMEDALSFDGNTGPYVQYTYARCCSVLSKVDGTLADWSGVELCSEERDVVMLLAQFPEKIAAAMRDYQPAVITRYVYDLAGAFNKFYHHCPILAAPDEATKALRVEVTRAVKAVLERGLGLICMETPERI